MNLTLSRFSLSKRVDAATVAKGGGLLAAMVLGLVAAFPSHAIDFANLGANNPLQDAMNTLTGLSNGVKGLIGFIGFVVALISLASLRNMGPVLFFVGLLIFGSVGLGIAASILGAPVGGLALVGAL